MKFNTGPNFTSQKTSLKSQKTSLLVKKTCATIRNCWSHQHEELRLRGTRSRMLVTQLHCLRVILSVAEKDMAIQVQLKISFPPGDSIIHQSLFCRRTAHRLAGFSRLPPFSWRNARVKGTHYGTLWVLRIHTQDLMLLQSVPHPLDHLPSPRLSMRIETLFSSSRMTMVSHDRSVLSSSADSSPTKKKNIPQTKPLGL